MGAFLMCYSACTCISLRECTVSFVCAGFILGSSLQVAQLADPFISNSVRTGTFALIRASDPTHHKFIGLVCIMAFFCLCHSPDRFKDGLAPHDPDSIGRYCCGAADVSPYACLVGGSGERQV